IHPPLILATAEPKTLCISWIKYFSYLKLTRDMACVLQFIKRIGKKKVPIGLQSSPAELKAPEVFTPTQFLLGPPSPLPMPEVFIKKDLILHYQRRLARRFADHFWSSWTDELLPTLSGGEKWIERKPPF